MKPYSVDLRTRIVRALHEEGTAKSAAARLFGVSRSSVKRYARIASRGESLKPRKGGGRPPKTDETTQKLLEEDVKERPAAAVSERRRFLEHTTGKVLSDSTVLRLLKRRGFSQKTDYGGAGARRVAKSRLEGGACLENRSEAARLRGRDGHEHLAFGAARLVATRTKGLLLGASQSGTANTTLLSSMTTEGMGPSLAVEGTTTTGAVFEAYVERVLCPVLSPGQIVVMDNLSAHKGERVRELIEGQGCELLYLPPYSPDLNPLEEVFAKIKGVLRKAEARNREALIEAIGRAISAVTARDVRGFFEHCGYGVSVQSL